MFCSKNKIKGSRKAKKAEVCWAIAQAKTQHDAGHLPPYKNPCPIFTEDGEDDALLRASTTAASLLLSDEGLEGDETPMISRANKKRRSDAVDQLSTNDPNGPGESLLQRFEIKLQNRIASSIEEKNKAIQLKESMDAASGMRRDIREEKSVKSSLLAQLIQEVGDEANEKIQNFKKTKLENDGEPTVSDDAMKDSQETLIERIVEQDNLIKQLTTQYSALSELISKLLRNTDIDTTIPIAL